MKILRSIESWFAAYLLLGVFLMACSGGDEQPADAGVDAGANESDGGDIPQKVKGYGPASSWVAWYPVDTSELLPLDKPCPMPLGGDPAWEYGRLFSPLSLISEMGGVDAQGKLTPDGDSLLALIKRIGTPDQWLSSVMGDGVFCRYEWTGKSLNQLASDALLKKIPLDDVDEDPGALVPLDPQMDKLNSDLGTDFWQATKAGMGASDLTYPIGMSRSEVMVAILDSNLTDFGKNAGLPGKGKLLHGRQVGLLIRSLTCPNNDAMVPLGSCPVSLADFLVLDREPDGLGGSRINRKEGGYFGTPAGLARMIWWSLIYSRFTNANARLLINISVGWENGPPVASRSLPVQAVKAALSHVRCAGALAIAAAGNSSGGSDHNSGPMGPAFFEDYDTQGCPQVPASEPMIYSVGGVDATGRPLANSRSGGRPALAAYSYQVSVDEQYLSPGKLSDPLISHPAMTGSSMAAAAGSALAALAWSYQLSSTAGDIMQDMYASGLDLGCQPDYCHGSFCQSGKIRRISFCHLFRYLQLVDPKQCTPLPDQNPGWSSDNQAQADTIVSTTSFDNLVFTEVPQCGVDARLYYDSKSEVPNDPCPDVSWPNYIASPQLLPQPRKAICPTCSFVGTTLYLGTDTNVITASPLLEGGAGSLNKFRLKLMGDGRSVYFDLTGACKQGDFVKVIGLSCPVGFTPQTAEILLRLKGFTGTELSLAQQIPLLP